MLLVAAASRNLTSALASMASGDLDIVRGRRPGRQDARGDRVRRNRPRRSPHRRARLRDARCRMHEARCAGARGDRSLRARDERLRGRCARRRFRQPAHACAARHRPVHQSRTACPDERSRLAHQHGARGGRGRRRPVRRAARRTYRGGGVGRVPSRALRSIRRRRRFRSLTNVILTPHVGSNTVESNRRMAERALQNIQLAQAGEFERMDLLNRDVLT